MINTVNKESRLKHIHSTLCDPSDQLWVLFNALGDCARYRMVKVLMYHRDMSVTDLAKLTSISVPAASQQLKTLESAGIVTKKRCGQSVCYELDTQNPYVYKAVKLIDAWLENQEIGKEFYHGNN